MIKSMITRKVQILYFIFLVACISPSFGASKEDQPNAGKADANEDVVVLSPFKVTARYVEMRLHYKTHKGKKIIQYAYVKNVVPNSIADKAGLKKKDRIVAIGDLRLEGLDAASLSSSKFSVNGKTEGDMLIVTYTIRRPKIKDEIYITLRHRIKKEKTDQQE